MIPRGIYVAVLTLVIAFVSHSALSSEPPDKSSVQLPMLSARADAALKKAEQEESLQKITSSPVTADASPNDSVVTDGSPVNNADLVKISPAPGTDHRFACRRHRRMVAAVGSCATGSAGGLRRGRGPAFA